jgi:glycosyltransferase involved in cell wall biosynthesis
MTAPGSRRSSPRVVHLTSAHPSGDVRIFAKECRTLAAAGYDVHLVAPGDHDGMVDGVRLHPVGAEGGRLRRMTGRVAQVYRIASELNADVYHFHDPELIPIALLLRARGKRVIYDVHEHVPQQIVTKPWIPGALRRPISMLADVGERLAARSVSAVVTATPPITRRFAGRVTRVVTVNNYPMLEEFPLADGDGSGRERAVCYAGNVTELRGALEMVRAIADTDARLLLAGLFKPPSFKEQLSSEPGWHQVENLGFVRRDELVRMMARARAGLVLLLPVPNHLEASPNKMFEYMSAGLPVIASDFPAWSRIVEEHECGICVDPTSPSAIAEAIRWVLEHPDAARRMGEHGRHAVERTYNWDSERRVLLGLYEDLVGPPRALPT